MPRNVRNFWIEAIVDGRDSRLASGPVSRDGGFYLDVSMRADGQMVSDVVRISGSATDDGTLTLTVTVLNREGVTVTGDGTRCSLGRQIQIRSNR